MGPLTILPHTPLPQSHYAGWEGGWGEGRDHLQKSPWPSPHSLSFTFVLRQTIRYNFFHKYIFLRKGGAGAWQVFR